MDLIGSKLSYFTLLDKKAKSIADDLINKSPVTNKILQVIINLYKSAKTEQNFSADERFLSAYHSPITSELEFFISRIFYYYSDLKSLNWIIFLRKQKKKTVPDIRIDIGNKTIAVIEIKAKAGWIQPLLSQDRYDDDMLRLNSGKSKYNPDELIEYSKNQLLKYKLAFDVDFKNIYFLLPTLVLVHRQRYDRALNDYFLYFEKTSGLSKNNLILLSDNLTLDLSRANSEEKLFPTNLFERMIYEIEVLSI